jgi:hypothetical protein
LSTKLASCHQIRLEEWQLLVSSFQHLKQPKTRILLGKIFIGEVLYDVAVVLGKRIFKEVFSGVLYHP